MIFLYNKTFFYYTIHGTNMVFFGTIKPPSLFPTLGGFPPWVPHFLELVPLAHLLCWYDGPNFLLSLPQGFRV